jgi:hypothetical protein
MVAGADRGGSGVTYKTDKQILEVVTAAAQSFVDACKAAADAGLELDIEYEREGEEPPTLDIEARRWLGRRIVQVAKMKTEEPT